jgi:hypothetical protein
MDIHDILALYDRQQRIDIEYPGMRKDVSPHIVRFVRPAPGMSTIQYSRLNEANADAVIQDQINYFTSIDQPFSWKVYDHDTPADLKDRLTAHGFKPDELEGVMVLDLNDVPASLLVPIRADVRPLTRSEQLVDVIRIEEQVWGSDFNWIAEQLGENLAIPHYLRVYVAYVDDQPACAGWTYFHPHGQFADLWGGSTVAEYRQRGLYTAILAIRVQEAQRRGYRFLTVDTSPMSRPIVAQHGFRWLTHAQDFDWSPNDTPLATPAEAPDVELEERDHP